MNRPERFFYVRQHGSPSFGRAVRETFGSAGSCYRFANPHGSALPFGDGKAVIDPLSRSLTMPQPLPTPAAGAPLFHRAYDLAALIGDCRSIALALPAVIPAGPQELDRTQLEHIQGLASAIGRLLSPAEDLAYALGSDLHDVFLKNRKGKSE